MNGSHAYVTRNGRLTRDNVVYLPRLSILRVILLLIVLTTLVVTNPANGLFAREIQNVRQQLGFFPLNSVRKLEWDQMVDNLERQQQPKVKTTKTTKDPSSSYYGEQYYSYLSSVVTTATKDLSSYLTTTLTKDRYTNYGIFVLGRQKTMITQITLTGLLHTVALCRTDSLDEWERELCLWVEDVGFVDNQKQGSLTSFVIQISSCILITAVLFSLCSATYGKVVVHMNPSLQPWFFQWLVSMWSSVDVLDVIRWNWIAKIALTSMERLIRTAPDKNIDKELLFWMSSFFLFVAIGIVATQYASRRLTKQPCNNLDGLFATCLGYTVGLGNQRLRRNFLLRLFVPNHLMTYPTFFWIHAGQLLLMNQYGPLVAVLTGGALGHVFGFVHTDWLLSSSLSTTMKKWWQQF